MERPVPVLALSLAAGIIGLHPAWLVGGAILLLLNDRRARASSSVLGIDSVKAVLLVAAGGVGGATLVGLEEHRMESCAAAGEWMDGGESAFEGRVIDAPLPTRRGWRMTVLLEVPFPGTVHLHSAEPCPPYRIGDRVRGLAQFDPWRPPANAGEFDLRRHRLARGISGRGRLTTPPPIIGFTPSRAWDPRPLMDDLRRRIRGGIETSVSDPTALGLAYALTIGERTALPDSVRDDFVRAGIAHLLAISGLHLALGAALVGGALRLLLLPIATRLPVRSLIIIPLVGPVPLVLAQTILAGAPPSCLRAATMLLYLAAARVLDRRPDTSTALGLAALVNLIHHPGAIHEAGFQLSFGATAAILMCVPRRVDSSRRLVAWILSLARVSVAAFLGTAPFVGWHFGPLPLAAPLVNLAAVPIASLALLPGALLLGGCSAIWGTAPRVLGWAFEVAACLETSLASVASEFGPSVQLVHGDVPWLSLVCAGLLWVMKPGAWLKRAWALILVGAVGLTIALLPSTPGHLDVWLLDVGEGNLAVLRLPCGRVMLMDGGPPGSGRRTLLPFLRAQGIRRVDDLLISHGHVDHYAGALEVYDDLGAPRIISNRSPLIHNALASQCSSKTSACSMMSPGQAVWDLCDVNLRIISPKLPQDNRDENERSLIVYLTTGSIRILFTGDMGPKGWASAAPLLPPGDVSLLQLPHHGHESPHLSSLVRRTKPLISFSFSDGAPENGGNRGVRQIVESYSSTYHISGLSGPLQLHGCFPIILFRGSGESRAYP